MPGCSSTEGGEAEDVKHRRNADAVLSSAVPAIVPPEDSTRSSRSDTEAGSIHVAEESDILEALYTFPPSASMVQSPDDLNQLDPAPGAAKSAERSRTWGLGGRNRSSILTSTPPSAEVQGEPAGPSESLSVLPVSAPSNLNREVLLADARRAGTMIDQIGSAEPSRGATGRQTLNQVPTDDVYDPMTSWKDDGNAGCGQRTDGIAMRHDTPSCHRPSSLEQGREQPDVVKTVLPMASQLSPPPPLTSSQSQSADPSSLLRVVQVAALSAASFSSTSSIQPRPSIPPTTHLPTGASTPSFAPDGFPLLPAPQPSFPPPPPLPPLLSQTAQLGLGQGQAAASEALASGAAAPRTKKTRWE